MRSHTSFDPHKKEDIDAVRELVTDGGDIGTNVNGLLLLNELRERIRRYMVMSIQQVKSRGKRLSIALKYIFVRAPFQVILVVS